MTYEPKMERATEAEARLFGVAELWVGTLHPHWVGKHDDCPEGSRCRTYPHGSLSVDMLRAMNGQPDMRCDACGNLVAGDR